MNNPKMSMSCHNMAFPSKRFDSPKRFGSGSGLFEAPVHYDMVPIDGLCQRGRDLAFFKGGSDSHIPTLRSMHSIEPEPGTQANSILKRPALWQSQ